MDKKQTGMVLDLIDLTYPGKLKVSDVNVFFETWHNFLKDYDFQFVMSNLHNYIKESPYLPSLHDLVTEKSKKAAEGRYIPNAQETYLEMQRIEQEKCLALTTSAEKVEKAQILAAKEKALRTIAEQVKRSEEENPYKVVERNAKRK